MDAIKQWFETTPYAVFILVVLFFILLGLLSWLGKKMSGMKASGIYKAASTLNLEVLSTSSGIQGNIPRISGFYKGRNIEISEYDKTQWGKTTFYTRFKLSHKISLTRRVELIHVPGEFPPIKEIHLDTDKIETSKLLKMGSFSENILREWENFLSGFSEGQIKQSTILTLDVNESCFDRDITQTGDENKIVSCLENFDRILKTMEDFEEAKKVRKP
ncbi:MAG: hypothetical protein LWY06_06495 [Firmicutes bacterium]|nr:hypothetical protein [Bacillota bacterium]